MKEYRTCDIGLAAALMTCHWDLQETYNNNGRIGFIFENNHGLKNIIDGYYSNSLEADLLTYNNNIRALKSRILSAKNE